MNVVYPDSGFGNIVGQLLEQKLKKPEKADFAKKIRGEITIEVRDLGVSATVRFMGDLVEVMNGSSEKADSTISANFKVINELVSGATSLRILKLMLTRKLRIKGIPMAKKFNALLA
ncbi:MAG: SCP2 sterol-binding domain-containing protein [Archaeoglobaceae archaeon]